MLHGSALDAADTVHVEACHRADGLIVSVSDPGRWQPGIERDPTVGGRGFKIMERVSDEVTIDTGPLGTNVALRWDHDLLPILPLPLPLIRFARTERAGECRSFQERREPEEVAMAVTEQGHARRHHGTGWRPIASIGRRRGDRAE